MKVYLDSNVLIAAVLAEHEHHERALPLLQSVHSKEVDGSTSAHCLVEVYAILTRLPRSPRITPLQASYLIEENILKHFEVTALSGKEYGVLVTSLGESGIAGGKCYDALHLACGRKSGVDLFYTFNVRHFKSLCDEFMQSKIVVPDCK